MIKQIKYFQAVVRCNSFTEAAEECFISQSAISQQIQALENELGVKLLNRENRKISLTPAGEHFYRKSLVLIADFERMCNETVRIAKRDQADGRCDLHPVEIGAAGRRNYPDGKDPGKSFCSYAGCFGTL